MTISPQGVQLNLALGQTFANNQYVSGIETMRKKNKRTVPICPTACFWLNCRWRAFGAPRGRGDVLGAERRGSCWQSAPNVGERYTSSLRCDGENLASEIELERMIAAS